MSRSILHARQLRADPDPAAGKGASGGGGGGGTDLKDGSMARNTGIPEQDAKFPADTPPASMTPEQQSAYWQHRSRQWEDRVKAFGGLTPDALTELKAKAERADKLEYDLSSDQEKALADARTAAATEAAGSFLPQIVGARLDAAAARAGISADQLEKATEYVDYEKFLDDKGQVNAEKVTAFVSAIKPATGRPGKGPSLTGHGAPGATGSSGRDRGLEEARKRFPQAATK